MTRCHTETSNRLEVGHPYGEFYLVRWSHVDPVDGQSVWLDKDGNYTKTYSEANRVQTGKNAIAPWTAGLSTTVSWKGLQLDVQFSGMFDRYMWNNERYLLENPMNASGGNSTTKMLDMWMKPGDITDVPAANCTRQLDTQFLENASFVRLKLLQPVLHAAQEMDGRHPLHQGRKGVLHRTQPLDLHQLLRLRPRGEQAP